MHFLSMVLYSFPIKKPKVGFSIKVSSSHVPCTQQPRSQNSDIAFRVRKEKERSISELIFDLRRARQAAGANVPDSCGGGAEGSTVDHQAIPTSKKQAKCMKHGD